MPRPLLMIQQNGDQYVVLELLVLSRALVLNNNWDVFRRMVRAAKNLRLIDNYEKAALLSLGLHLKTCHQEGTPLGFRTLFDAKNYTYILYTFMKKAQIPLPSNIEERQYLQYVQEKPEKDKNQALVQGFLAISNYRTKTQQYIINFLTGFVAFLFAGGLAFTSALGLRAAGWPLGWVITAAVCIFTLVANERWILSGGRIGRFIDRLSRKESGLYDGVYRRSWLGLTISTLMLATVGFALIAPAMGMFMASKTAFGILAIVILYLLTHNAHAGGSLWDTTRQGVEKLGHKLGIHWSFESKLLDSRPTLAELFRNMTFIEEDSPQDQFLLNHSPDARKKGRTKEELNQLHFVAAPLVSAKDYREERLRKKLPDSASALYIWSPLTPPPWPKRL